MSVSGAMHDDQRLSESLAPPISSIDITDIFDQNQLAIKDIDAFHQLYPKHQKKTLKELITESKLSIVGNGVLAAQVNSFRQKQVCSSTYDKVFSNKAASAIRILESIGDEAAISAFNEKLKSISSSFRDSEIDPSIIIHSFCTLKDHISISSGYASSSIAFIGRYYENDQEIWVSIIDSFCDKKEYIIANNFFYNFTVHQELVDKYNMEILYSIGLTHDTNEENTILLKRQMKAVPSSSSIQNDLIAMKAISNAGLPISHVFTSFNSVPKDIKNETLIAIYMNEDQFIAYKLLQQNSSIICDANQKKTILFTKLFITSIKSQIQKPHNPLQKSIQSYSIDMLEKVCETAMDYYRQKYSIQMNFDDPSQTMKFVTQMLYSKDPNNSQCEYARSEIFVKNENTPIDKRVFFLSTPPGSGKTACEIMPAVMERFRSIDLRNGESHGITIIATSLVQVSAQISASASMMIASRDKWLKVKRLDGAAKELSNGDYAKNLNFMKNIFQDIILNIPKLISRITKDIDIQNVIHDIFSKLHVEEDKSYIDMILSSFSNEEEFKENILPNILNNFSVDGWDLSDCIVGTFEMVSFAICGALNNERSDEVIEKIKYIVIDEWDTIFRVQPMTDNSKPLMHSLQQRFSFSYSIVALSILILRANPKCKLILVSGTGSEMLHHCQERMSEGIVANMLEPLLRPIVSFCEYDEILQKMKEMSSSNESDEMILRMMQEKISKINEYLESDEKKYVEILSNDLWGTRKINLISTQDEKAGTNIVFCISHCITEIYQKLGIIRFSDILQSDNYFDHITSTIMHLCSLFLVDMNVGKTIDFLSSQKALSSWSTMLSVIVSALMERNRSISDKISLIFIQKKELHSSMLVLIGIILLILNKDGKINRNSLSQRSPSSNEFLLSTASSSFRVIQRFKENSCKSLEKNLFSVDHIKENTSQTRKRLLDLDLVNSMSDLYLCSCGITKELLLHHFNIDQLWKVCEFAISCGVVSITRETASEEIISNYISHQQRYPIVAICTSRLGEGVDLSNPGPVFVISHSALLDNSPSNRDCEQWIGRGYRNTKLSVCGTVNPPSYDNPFIYSGPTQEKFIESHKIVYSGFLSSDIARKIASLNCFSHIISNSQSCINLCDILPQVFQEMGIHYFSPIRLHNMLKQDESPSIDAVSNAIESKIIHCDMIVHNSNMFELSTKVVNEYMLDIILTDTLNFTYNIWPVFASSMFLSLVSKCRLENDQKMYLFDFTRNVVKLLIHILPNNQIVDKLSAIENMIMEQNIEVLQKLLNECKTEIPDLANSSSIISFCQTIGKMIGETNTMLPLIFICLFGLISQRKQIESIGPNPEGFSLYADVESKIDVMKAIHNSRTFIELLDLIYSLGFGFQLENMSYDHNSFRRRNYKKPKEPHNIIIGPGNCRPLLFYFCYELNPFLMKIGANNSIIIDPEKELAIYKCISSCIDTALISSNVQHNESKQNEGKENLHEKFSNMFCILVKHTKPIHDPRIDLMLSGLLLLNDIYDSIKTHRERISETKSPFIAFIEGFCTAFFPQFDISCNTMEQTETNFDNFMSFLLQDC